MGLSSRRSPRSTERGWAAKATRCKPPRALWRSGGTSARPFGASKFFANFPSFLSSFSKDFFGGFEPFQRVTRQKFVFLRDSKFFGFPRRSFARGLSQDLVRVAGKRRTLERRDGEKQKPRIAQILLFGNTFI